MRANAADRLLQHYVDNFRPLPWRSPPGEPPPEPYKVWLSEVMLQQTTVAAVIPRYQRFLERWPTVEVLAAATDDEILSEWAGLGYYARARNLIACAREVARRGGFPDSEAELRKLRGIGDYTAAAIAAIAFGRPSAPVDTNVTRVIARLDGLSNPQAPDIGRSFKELTPAGRSGDFAQALMDLGATICRPRDPICGRCPLSSQCSAFASGRPEAYPAPKVRPAKPLRHGVAHWIERSNCLWLIRRPGRGLLGGMAALPGSEWTDEPQDCPERELARVRHVFTHFVLDLAVVESSRPSEPGWWQPIAALDNAGLPTLYRRAVEAILDRRAHSRAA